MAVIVRVLGAPLRTAFVCSIIVSTVIGSVVEWPYNVIPKESPIPIKSIPERSAHCAIKKSAAATITTRSPFCFFVMRSGTVSFVFVSAIISLAIIPS